MTAKIEAYQDAFKPLIERGLSAIAITQFSDLEIERNGLLTYDRRFVKVHADRVRNQNLEMIAAGETVE